MNPKLLFVVSAFIISCSSNEADKSLIREQPVAKNVTVVTTAKGTDLRLTQTGQYSSSLASQPLESEISVFVNPKRSFQTFLGIGGAITDASAEVFYKLPEDKQQELINAYFGKEGIDYTLLRTTIHSCDFSSESYTYVEEGDKDLNTFSIEHDKQYRIPMIKLAMSQATSPMPFYVSPWSPPAFMKGRENMLNGGKLLPEFYQSWANYYAKFIKAYEEEGLPIWGLTIQNEPMAVQTWESCIYTAEEERDFLKNNLGPTLEKSGLGDKKIIVWDHNRDLISHRANIIFEDPDAAKYVWGIGFHWYETWAGGDPKWENLRNVKESYPDKELIFTEGCVEAFDSTQYYRWSNAERYGISMINDFNCGTVGWTDWNILLDHNGGPNHVGNFCFAPLHANTNTGEIIYTPSYYYIGHFSKFIRPNAKRISTTTSHTNLLSTSFMNENNEIITLVMNLTSSKIAYKLYVERQEVALEILPNSIQTLIY